jgi:cell division protein FtsL
MRLNLALLAVLLACALSVVTSSHRARNLASDLEREKNRSHDLDVEWRQLLLEQSTLANPVRIDRIARDKLAMHAPAAARIVSLDAAAATGQAGTP